jgi:hypothetical protein
VMGAILNPDLIPDAWFGQTRGTVTVSQGQASIISPPNPTPGPVNLKLIYPDGDQVFSPQSFSYSTFPTFTPYSGSSPNGGAPATVIGYGLPIDSAGGTVTVGGSAATITSQVGQYPPYSGEPFPSTILDYNFPAGKQGPADLTVTTPIGSGTLSKAIYYAKSVTDYGSSDTFTAVLYDATRNQVYLAAGDHVDVFSMTSNQYTTPLQPAAIGTQKLFSGLALTPDGSQLLVTDLLDNSLAVINPDTPTNTFAVSIPPQSPINGCPVGPLYVAATSVGTAFVGTGSMPQPSCPPSGSVYIVNLTSKTVSTPPANAPCGITAWLLDGSSDGNYIAFGSTACVLSVQTSTYKSGSFSFSSAETGIAISGDANVVASGNLFTNIGLSMLGSIANPLVLYNNAGSSALSELYHPRLNASGSLYYLAYPNYFEIVDVEHALLRMRFSLTEVVQTVASPIAIDSGGRYVFLLTDQGLTVVDLGEAPLSIGHLSVSTAAPGAQITVRGSGFDSATTATVGGVAATVSFTDQNTLTLTVPTVTVGPEDIVLTRGDGETYTLENGIVVQ